MLRKQMFMIFLILLFSSLIINTTSCQQCEKVKELERKVEDAKKVADEAIKKSEKARQEVEKARQEVEKVRQEEEKARQEVEKVRQEEENQKKFIMKSIFIIVGVLFLYYALKHLLIHKYRNKDY